MCFRILGKLPEYRKVSSTCAPEISPRLQALPGIAATDAIREAVVEVHIDKRVSYGHREAGGNWRNCNSLHIMVTRVVYWGDLIRAESRAGRGFGGFDRDGGRDAARELCRQDLVLRRVG